MSPALFQGLSGQHIAMLDASGQLSCANIDLLYFAARHPRPANDTRVICVQFQIQGHSRAHRMRSWPLAAEIHFSHGKTVAGASGRLRSCSSTVLQSTWKVSQSDQG